MSGESVGGVKRLIHRLGEALELQDNTEGEITSTPAVSYCFECDKIEVDSRIPAGCLDHKTVSSDGYEHAGIQSAMTALRHVVEDTDREGSDD